MSLEKSFQYMRTATNSFLLRRIKLKDERREREREIEIVSHHQVHFANLSRNLFQGR